MALGGLAAEGQDGRMFDEQQPIADRSVGPGPGQLFLDRPDGAVVGTTEPLGLERAGLGSVDRAEGVGAGDRVHRRTIAGLPIGAVTGE